MQKPRFDFAGKRMALGRVQELERVLGSPHPLKHASCVERDRPAFELVVEGGLQREERLEAEHVLALSVRGPEDLSGQARIGTERVVDPAQRSIEVGLQDVWIGPQELQIESMPRQSVSRVLRERLQETSGARPDALGVVFSKRVPLQGTGRWDVLRTQLRDRLQRQARALHVVTCEPIDFGHRGKRAEPFGLVASVARAPHGTVREARELQGLKLSFLSLNPNHLVVGIFRGGVA